MSRPFVEFWLTKGSRVKKEQQILVMQSGHAGAAGRLRFICKSLAGCSIARIVEEELIAVGIIDHQEPVTPRTLLDRNALGLEFRAQRIHRSNRSLSRLRLDVQRNEHQPLANLLRPRVGQDKRA